MTVKEIAGNHRYQTTTGSKPILRGTPVGNNLFTSYGTPGAGWVDSGGGVGTATTSSAALPTTISVGTGNYYRVQYTITRSAGSVQLSMGGRTGISRSAAGTYVDYFDNTTNTNTLTITGTGFTGTISAIDARNISDGAVTAPYGLQYDGIDDFLTTASVDFTATDKMAVVMGVRKLSDAVGIVTELSANVTSNTGSFYVVAGLDNENYWSGASRGSAAAVIDHIYGSTTAIGPETIVGAWTHDIAGDQTRMRKNGVLATSARTGNGDKGTGNFGNYAMFFGRRGGTTVPFNGLDFGGICVNKTLTASQLSSAERWVAQRTGVVL
jgi:hypothetical protein